MSRDLFTDRASARALIDHLQQRARALDVALPAPPEEPTTCCGRGCQGCVWDGYYDAAAYWWEEANWRLEDAVA